MVKKLDRIFQRGVDGSESTGRALSGMFFKTPAQFKLAKDEMLAAEDYKKIRAARRHELGKFAARDSNIVVWPSLRDGLLRPGARHDQDKLDVPASHQESQAA